MLAGIVGVAGWAGLELGLPVTCFRSMFIFRVLAGA